MNGGPTTASSLPSPTAGGEAVVDEYLNGLIELAARLARASGAQSAVLHFAFLYGGTSLLVLTLRYQLHSYFSDAVSFALLKQLGGGSAADALLFAKNEIMLGVGALLLFLAAWWLAARLLRRWLGRQPALASPWPRWKTVALVWLAFAGAVIVLPRLGGDAPRLLRDRPFSATVSAPEGGGGSSIAMTTHSENKNKS